MTDLKEFYENDIQPALKHYQHQTSKRLDELESRVAELEKNGLLNLLARNIAETESLKNELRRKTEETK